MAYEVTPMGTAWHTQTTLSYDVYIRVWLKASVSKNTARAHRNSASSHGAPVPCPAASAHGRGKEAFVRSMHFEKKVKPSVLAGSFDRDLSCVCRFLGQKKTPQRSGPPTKLTEAMVSKTIHILRLQGLQAHPHGLRPMPPGHSPD